MVMKAVMRLVYFMRSTMYVMKKISVVELLTLALIFNV